MSSRRQTIDPLAETPFWRSRGFLFACIGAAALLLIGGTAWLVRENRRQQLQWRLDEDPYLSRIKKTLTAAIADARPGDERAPRALWLGQVKRVERNQRLPDPAGGGTVNEASYLIEFDSPALLAGSRGKKETTPLQITGPYSFNGQPPKAGETWLIAVRRDKNDRSLIHFAVRADLKQ